MSHFSEMEWNKKWDWENFFGFGPKSIESPKKLQQLADYAIVDDGEIHAGSFDLSGSDGGQGSSAKSSISASTDSPTKKRFRGFEGYSGNFNQKMEMSGTEVSRTSSPLPEASSVGSVEPSFVLKLGYGNSNGGGNVKSTSFSVMPTPSNTSVKKSKSSGQNAPTPRCQVEGCNSDLSVAKEYHRKHRVCDNHSKCTKVTVGGHERRFCQQCSRFHSLAEFDDKKRSCRRRLADHNARRRKPQQETIQFNSTRLSSPFYGGTQQMSFVLNNSPLMHSRTPANSTWDSASNSKFTLTKGYSSKFNGDGGTGEQLHMPGIMLPRMTNMHNAATGVFPFKNSSSEVLNPGSKGSMISCVDAAPEYRRALSLLSNNSSWDSCKPEPIPLPSHLITPENDTTQLIMNHHHPIPEGLPLTSSDFWLTGQHSTTTTNHRLPPLATTSSFQEIQLSKTPYEPDFYLNM